MEESKIPLPYWLPWATTAVLAALVACIGELWIIEKARYQILQEDNALVVAELKATNNQLEAERIIDLRVLSARSDIGVALLAPPTGASSTVYGAVVWSPYTQQGFLSFSGLRKDAAEGIFQLWVSHQQQGKQTTLDPLGGWTTPKNCAVFAPPSGKMPVKIPITVDAPLRSAQRFTLTFGKKGSANTFEEAVAEGSIVLASPSP
jgi:hypothetical protein